MATSKSKNNVYANGTCKKYRMVALDLDGTLLNNNHEISEASVSYLRNLHQRGLIISIATGRAPIATAEVIRRLDLHFTDTGSACTSNSSTQLSREHSHSNSSYSEGFPAVTTNGARGIQVSINRDITTNTNTHANTNPMLDGRMSITHLFHRPLSKDLAQKVLRLSKCLGCVTNYYVDHDIYAQIDDTTPDWHLIATKKYTTLTGCHFIYCKDEYSEALERGEPAKMLILCQPDDIDSTYQQVEEALGNEAQVIRGSPPWFVEVLNIEVNKGAGVQLMCEKLGVSMEECIAFGDGHNDLEAIQQAGLGVAMKNAHEHVKSVADEITEYTNSEVSSRAC